MSESHFTKPPTASRSFQILRRPSVLPIQPDWAPFKAWTILASEGDHTVHADLTMKAELSCRSDVHEATVMHLEMQWRLRAVFSKPNHPERRAVGRFYNCRIPTHVHNGNVGVVADVNLHDVLDLGDGWQALVLLEYRQSGPSLVQPLDFSLMVFSHFDERWPFDVQEETEGPL